MPTDIAETIRNKPSIADNIAFDLQAKIEGGVYPLGSRLPGRRALAAEYSVAPLIIQKAINNLTASGLIAAENGRGTFVARSSPLTPKRLGTVGIVTYVYDSWKGSGVRIEKATLIMQAVERSVTAAGGSSVFCNRYRPDGTPLSMAQAVESVIAQGATAIVFVLEQDDELFRSLSAATRTAHPMVCVVWDQCELPMSMVYYDSVDAGRTAANHLIERGCKRILFLSTGVATWSERRIAGAREAVAAAGASVQLDVRVRTHRLIPNALVDVEYEAETADFSREILDGEPQFDGVIGANDRIAVTFKEVALGYGRHAGKDYALIGFDNDDEARAAGLTTMQAPWQRMGQEAVQLLERIIEHPGTLDSIRLRSHLICRTSTHIHETRRHSR